ncbi:MAG: hypothetical protein J6K17_01310 [Oscillospiraceae bacterium]|nr:hypothetical protein [Oscillospiraceae bacterium]
MQIMIECEYCNSLYDFSENHSCPNCAAIPDKKKVAAAKATAKAETKKSTEYAVKSDYTPEKPPSSMFITIIVKLIPLWIFLIIGLTFVPNMAEKSAAKKAYENFQTIDEITYIEHSMNEEFIYDNKINLEIDDAFYAESEVVDALLPDGMKLLVVHIKGSIDKDMYNSYDYNDYMRVKPYITNGTVCRENLGYSALNSIPEIYGNTQFSFSNFYSFSSEKDGYWCFIIDGNDTNLSLCIGDFNVKDYALNLECVHKIDIVIAKEES